MVEFAPHALAAMDAVDTVRPDVILLDLLLAGGEFGVVEHGGFPIRRIH